jgi:hypothetical protein
MFRRVSSSVPIPRHMFRALHINTAAQAARLCPPLCVIPSSIAGTAPLVSVCQGLSAMQASEVSADFPVLAEDSVLNCTLAELLRGLGFKDSCPMNVFASCMQLCLDTTVQNNGLVPAM